MPEYMKLPPKRPVLKDVLLPVGTRIKFVRELSSGPDDYSEGNLYATEGSSGEVTGHGCWEGHWVKWDNWKHPFGAEHGKDFIKFDEVMS